MAFPDSIATDLAGMPVSSHPPAELCKRGEIRVERFLDAATEVFIEKGYQHARLSDIVALAGGSLATLYRVFGDKDGLARAIIQRGLKELGEGMEPLNLSGLPPEQALSLTAARIAENLCTTQSMVVHRITIGEGQSFPDLRDWFFDHAVQAVRDDLTSYFEQEISAGRMRMASASLASTHFFMMVFGDQVMRVSSGNLRNPDLDELKSNARAAVEVFLYGALPR